MPGGEYIFMLADDVDQVVVALGMNLEVSQELEFVGLQGVNDLRFEICGGAALGNDVLPEDGHLLVREVCISKNVLYFYETFM